MAPTVRTLDQILSEIGGVYTPQVQSLQAQMADIPSQVQAEEQGLEAKQKTAFGDILNSARRRGTGVAFGGIPASEQAQYTASTYLPALANLRTAAKTQATSLQDAINQIHERRQNAALSLQQNDQSRFDAYQQQQAALAESRRQAAAASAASDISRYFSANTAPTASNGPTVTPEDAMTFKRAKSLEAMFRSGATGEFNTVIKQLRNSSDPAAKQVILSAYRLLNMQNSPALKNWGLI